VSTHLLYFEEKLRQNGELTPKLKETALQAQKYSSHYYSSKTSSSSSSMNDQIITKMFERILNLEEHNKERDEKGMMCICFSCHKECHTIHDCSLVFPQKKKQNFERIGAMLATSNHIERKNMKIAISKNMEILYDIVISKNMKMNSFAPKV
jgi:mRNA-degrading endonuclease YafQ of YafQ-DinJ toxin-antitoxin module